MSREDDRSSSSWTSMPPEPAFNGTSTSSDHFILPPMRFSGDGYDMRTPVMSDHSNFIDLTGESETFRRSRSGLGIDSTTTSYRANRPPRFSRDIIDLDPENGSGWNDEIAGDASPEVEILGSAPSVSSRRQNRPREFADIASTLRPVTHTHGARGGRNGDATPIFEYIRNIVRHTTASAIDRQNINAVIDEEELQRSNTNDNSRGYRRIHFDLETPGELFFQRDYSRTQLPEGLQYDLQGFPMGDLPPPVPTYNAPPPPRDGFTRSPTEEQEVICPNCDKELGRGDDEVKQSVWVVKSCGHVRLWLKFWLDFSYL